MEENLRHDRRSSDAALDRVLNKLDAIGKTVEDNHSQTIDRLGTLNTTLQVHITEDKAMAEKVEKHEERWEGIDRAKSRGLVFAGLALLSSGALGAWGKDLAGWAKKLFLE